MEGGLDGVLDAAKAAPGCALLQIYAALFSLYAGTEQGKAQAVQWLDQAEPALKGVRRSLQVLEYIALNPGRATDVAAGLEPTPEPDSEYFVGRNPA